MLKLKGFRHAAYLGMRSKQKKVLGWLNSSAIVFFALISMSGCAGRPETHVKDRDIEQSPNLVVLKGNLQYPHETYLTGMGHDRDIRVAKDYAREEIARELCSEIKSRTEIVQTYYQKTYRKDVKVDFDVSFVDRLEITTRKNLTDIRIADVFLDQNSGNYIAVAILDRQHAMSGHMGKIKGLDRNIRYIFENAETEPDPLLKIRLLQEALVLCFKREAFNAELRVINPAGQGVSGPTGFSEIKTRLESIMYYQLTFGTEISGLGAGEIERSLTKILNQKGMTHSLLSPAFTIKGQINLKPIDESRADWKLYQWDLVLRLYYQHRDRTISTIHENGVVGDQTYPKIVAESVKRINRRIENQIAVRLIDNLFNFDSSLLD